MSLVQVSDRTVRIDGRLVRIARLDGETYVYTDNPQAIIDGLHNIRHRVDLLTFIQQLPDTEPKYGYAMEWDNLAVLPLTSFEYWWTKQIDSSARNKIRKAEKKGVVAREVALNATLISGIQAIYNESPVRQGRRFCHFREDVNTTYQQMSTFPDKTSFIGAFLDGTMIGFMRLVSDDKNTMAGAMSILSMLRHRDKAPTNALVAQAVRFCTERGMKYLVYSSFAYGKKKPDSLAEFKLNNGFERVDVPRYYVPLTRLGEVVLRLGLHHPVRDCLPESLVSRARDLRNAWYGRKVARLQES